MENNQVKVTGLFNNEIGTFTCQEEGCGTEFKMTVLHQSWYVKKGLKIPTRCPDCRAERKANRESTDTASSGVA